MRKIAPFLLLLAVIAAAFFIGRRIGYFQAVSGPYTVKVDTVYHFDTVRVYEPQIVEKRVVDTMVVESVDYIVVHDTAFVQLPREEVTYQDTAYRAVVSGYLPRLEELEIYKRERVVTVETERIVRVSERTRWGLGFQVGAGVNTSGQLQPYIGVGLSYNLLGF